MKFKSPSKSSKLHGGSHQIWSIADILQSQHMKWTMLIMPKALADAMQFHGLSSRSIVLEYIHQQRMGSTTIPELLNAPMQEQPSIPAL